MATPLPSRGEEPDAGHFAYIEALFTALAERPAGERQQALGAIADPVIRGRIAALLAAHDRLSDKEAAAEEAATPLGVGDTVGAYRLLEKVGAGGMGEVFRAERADGLFTQQVAVKITRAQVAHPDLLRRFAVERQILASLNHPHIVGLIDGGATATGQAYLIMDYLDGESVTRYARTHALSLEHRLRLFVAVCSAVQYAHQHGVVHRDLKPANILVARDGVPKVVDFGIAKLLETGDGPQMTLAMWPGPLTPNYASPEQLRGLPITTASDVYALGVVLYELLAGTRPYETEGQPLDRVMHMVLNDEPPRPSEASVVTEDLPPYALTRLRGDLDAIVLKAMSKSPEGRYASAGELASDVERWLSGDPVLARTPSTAYVLKRLAARHRTLVATAGVALAAVLAALAVAAWQWQSARTAQVRAEQSLRDVRQLANALIFKIHDAVRPLAGSTPVRRTIVDEALTYLARLEQDASRDPALLLELAAAHRQLGGILGNPAVPNLGDRPAAIAQYEKAQALIAPLVTGPDHIDVVTALVHGNVVLASLYGGRGDKSRAVTLSREALDFVAAYARRHPDDPRAPRLVGQARFALSGALEGAEAIAEWERTLEHYERMLAAAPDSADAQRNVALVGKYLGGAFETQGEPARARPHYERALALDQRRLEAAPDSRSVQFDAAISFSNLASVAEAQDDFETAGPLFERSLSLRRMLSETDPDNTQAADRYAYLLARVSGFHRRAHNVQRSIEMARAAVNQYEALGRKTGDKWQQRGLGYSLMQLGLAEKAAGHTAAGCATLHRSHQVYAGAGQGSSNPRPDEAVFVADEVARCN